MFINFLQKIDKLLFNHKHHIIVYNYYLLMPLVRFKNHTMTAFTTSIEEVCSGEHLYKLVAQHIYKDDYDATKHFNLSLFIYDDKIENNEEILLFNANTTIFFNNNEEEEDEEECTIIYDSCTTNTCSEQSNFIAETFSNNVSSFLVDESMQMLSSPPPPIPSYRDTLYGNHTGTIRNHSPVYNDTNYLMPLPTASSTMEPVAHAPQILTLDQYNTSKKNIKRSMYDTEEIVKRKDDINDLNERILKRLCIDPAVPLHCKKAKSASSSSESNTYINNVHEIVDSLIDMGLIKQVNDRILSYIELGRNAEDNSFDISLVIDMVVGDNLNN